MYHAGGQDGENPFFSREMANQRQVFDGKRMRKPIQRRTVDYQSPAVLFFERRVSQRDYRDYFAIQPTSSFIPELLPPIAQEENSAISMCSKFTHTSTNKERCPVNRVVWTPEGRRLITGITSGEFTLWNGLTFNFETILQAHSSAVRSMIWSHDEEWMVTGDHQGCIKYWQSNMNNVKAFDAHKAAIRGLAFSPSDMKLASCSDDITIKIWDFARCESEMVLAGHGWDIKCISWHPYKSMLVSGGKDNFIKIWDPKTGKIITTLYGHKNTVLEVLCNNNGNWLLSASRDQLLRLYDLRMLKELQTFRGHPKEVTAAAWHPVHETMFCSGGFDGSIMYWVVGKEEPQAEVLQAHESSVWSLAWHPLGHILCSGSNDHTTKFWCRNRPGDPMKDKHNCATSSEDADADQEGNSMDVEDDMGGSFIPGIGDMPQYQGYPQNPNNSRWKPPGGNPNPNSYGGPPSFPSYNQSYQQPGPAYPR